MGIAVTMDDPLIRSDAELAAVVAQPTHYPGGAPDRPWTYVPWDKAFRPGDPEGGFNRYGWNDDDQAAFEALWPADGDRWVDALIEDYGALWPWLIGRVLKARAPGLETELERLYEAKVIGRPPPGAYAETRTDGSMLGIILGLDDQGSLIAKGTGARTEPRHWGNVRRDRAIVIATALMHGPFERARARRTWPPAPSYPCPQICGAHQDAGYLAPWMLEALGPPRYCLDCNIRIRTGRVVRSQAEAASGVRRLAAALERIPGQTIHYEPINAYAPAKRDEIAAALIVAPDPVWAQKAVKGKWLDVLKSAGLIEDGWRSSRGTYCSVADGHPCRSIAERSVDDWLSAHGVTHEPEPRYPGSSRRADWRLPDGTLVEYAGLLGDEGYAAKMVEKRRIALEAGVRLIVLVPEDLRDLGQRLGPWAVQVR